jgi:cell shape-determining protein MreC
VANFPFSRAVHKWEDTARALDWLLSPSIIVVIFMLLYVVIVNLKERLTGKFEGILQTGNTWVSGYILDWLVYICSSISCSVISRKSANREKLKIKKEQTTDKGKQLREQRDGATNSFQFSFSRKAAPPLCLPGIHCHQISLMFYWKHLPFPGLLKLPRLP